MTYEEQLKKIDDVFFDKGVEYLHNITGSVLNLIDGDFRLIFLRFLYIKENKGGWVSYRYRDMFDDTPINDMWDNLKDSSKYYISIKCCAYFFKFTNVLNSILQNNERHLTSNNFISLDRNILGDDIYLRIEDRDHYVEYGQISLYLGEEFNKHRMYRLGTNTFIKQINNGIFTTIDNVNKLGNPEDLHIDTLEDWFNKLCNAFIRKSLMNYENLIRY